MGLAGISPWSLILIVMIALLLFGTNRVKTLGSDLANIIKDFRKTLNDEEKSLKNDKSDQA